MEQRTSQISDPTKSQSTTTTTMSTIKSVSFSENACIRMIPHINEIPAKHRLDLWYSKNDFHSMRVMDKLLLNDMSKGNDLGQACVRGLEGRTVDGSEKRLAAISEAVELVLNEQHRQTTSGKPLNWERIASRCEQVTRKNAQDALSRGTADANVLLKPTTLSRQDTTTTERTTTASYTNAPFTPRRGGRGLTMKRVRKAMGFSEDTQRSWFAMPPVSV